jgi:hypothetical protein
VFAFAVGCDAINVGREALLAIGCPFGARTVAESFGYTRGVGLPFPADDAAIRELMPA